MKRFGTLGTSFAIGMGVAVAVLAVVMGGRQKDNRPTPVSTEVATQDFRARFAHGEFAQVYSSAAPEFRADLDQALFVRAMQKMSRKLGPLQSAKEVAVKKVRNSDDKIVFEYQSQFANGDATERFVWRNDGGQTLLVGYQVNSKALDL
jgi:uncharacterized protein DUF4019